MACLIAVSTVTVQAQAQSPNAVFWGELQKLCGKAFAGTLAADRGEVEVFDSPLHRLDKKAVTQFRAENIGFIFQQYNLIPTLNCIENVSVPLRIQGKKAAVAEKKAAEMLDAVGLGKRMKHRPNMLSGGQQQRVAIARALVHEPKLIICDEPTAALDSENGKAVMELLKEVAKDPTRAVMAVTHDHRTLHYADRIITIEDGRIVSDDRSPNKGGPAPSAPTDTSKKKNVAA